MAFAVIIQPKVDRITLYDVETGEAEYIDSLANFETDYGQLLPQIPLVDSLVFTDEEDNEIYQVDMGNQSESDFDPQHMYNIYNNKESTIAAKIAAVNDPLAPPEARS